MVLIETTITPHNNIGLKLKRKKKKKRWTLEKDIIL